MEESYVISILRVRDYADNECKPYWEYASHDRYAGGMSSGYPCFDRCLSHADRYHSVKEAENAFNKWWDNFRCCDFNEKYDIDSLAIRKINIVTKKKLTVTYYEL